MVAGLPCGRRQYFSQTAAISRNNIWAVADTFTRKGKTIYRPFIRHFNGSSWRAVTIPRSTGFTDSWVSASSARNIWIGGLKKGRAATTVAYRWNGARWAKIPVPALTELQSVTVLGPDNVWATVTSGTVDYDIFHWNGHRWQHYLRNSINFIPQDISASARNDVWVSGLPGARLRRSSGRRPPPACGPNTPRMPHPAFNNAGPMATPASRSNVWIGWYDNSGPHVLRWNGHRWHTVAASGLANPLDIVPDGKGGYWFGAQAILTGSTWTPEVVPGFTGEYGGVTRIPGTTSFLLTAGIEASGSSTQKPTIFRFDL